MASAYPAALDSLATNKSDDTDSKSGADLGVSTTTGDHAQHHNDLADAINKMETALGISPAGLYAATVRERFEIGAYKNQSARLATQTGQNITGTYANGTAGVGATKTVGGTTLSIDGTLAANGDRVLLKDQTTAAENGIYTVSGIGTAVLLTRAIDADTSAKIADCKVLVDAGTVNSDTEWYQSSTAPTMGTTALYFRRSQPIYGHGNPRSPWAPGFSTSVAPSIMETLPRSAAQGTDTLVIGTATQYLWGGIVAPAGRAISNINYIATTAGAAPTVSWLALVRQSDRMVMAHTANIVTAPTAGVVTTRPLAAAGAWTPTYDTPIWVLLSYANATTAMVLAASPNTGIATANLIAPAMSATNGVVPTTTLPVDNSTIVTAATVGRTALPYIWLT